MVENVGWALYNVLMYDAQNLSLVQAFFKNKWVRLVLVFDALLVVVLVGVMIFENTKSAMVDILTVPSVAKVRIGGGEYKSGAYKIHPGDYEAEVKADGFVTKTVPVSAREGEISKVWVYLVPEEGNMNYYAQHEEDWENMRLLDDEEAQRVYKLLSISDVLPLYYTEHFFDTDGEISMEKDVIVTTLSSKNDFNCQEYYCLQASTYLLNEDESIIRKMLVEEGYNLDDYGMKWRVYDGDEPDFDIMEELNE